MQTTETPARWAGTAGILRGPLVVAALVSTALGLVLAAVAATAGGGAAATGALLGTLIAVLVFAFGSFAVDVVARVMPAASLMVAMTTYLFQIVVLALAFVALQRSGALDHQIDRAWLGGAIIVCALAWSFAQLRATVTARIPVYDIARDSVSTGAATGHRPTTEGGAG